MNLPLEVRAEVAAALAEGVAVVALETTVLAHGLPWPGNLQTVQAMFDAVREEGAVPAAIGIRGGRVVIGLEQTELEHFARAEGIAKASRRDLAVLLTRGVDGATTVAATMLCAHAAGIAVFATGGIGGVHRGVAQSWDISADLRELGRTPVAVVCSGAKSILDLAKTLEVLEYEGVPVIGLGTDRFPAFFVRDSGLPVSARVDGTSLVARVINTQLGLGEGGILIANPIPARAGLQHSEVERWTELALAEAAAHGVLGKALTPYLLARIAALSDGQTLQANRALLVDNAAVAARIALQLGDLPRADE